MAMFTNAPMSGPYAPPCDSRCFEGVARGTMIGVAWTLANGSEEARPRSLHMAMAKNCFGFSSFLGVFTVITCMAERSRQVDDPFNSFFGGCAAGAFVAFEKPKLSSVATTSLATGLICAAFWLVTKR